MQTYTYLRQWRAIDTYHDAKVAYKCHHNMTKQRFYCSSIHNSCKKLIALTICFSQKLWDAIPPQCVHGGRYVEWIFNTLRSWWRHQMEAFSASLALCAGNSPVTGNSHHKGQWRGALMFSSMCLNKRLSKQSRCLWFQTPPRSLRRHWNAEQNYHLGGLISDIYLCMTGLTYWLFLW